MEPSVVEVVVAREKTDPIRGRSPRLKSPKCVLLVFGMLEETFGRVSMVTCPLPLKPWEAGSNPAALLS